MRQQAQRHPFAASLVLPGASRTVVGLGRAGLGLAGVLVAVLGSGCSEELATAEKDAADVGGLETIVAPQGQEIEFALCDPEEAGQRLCGTLSMRVVACSARVSCEPSLLHDPRTLERGPTLVTGFSCGFPEDHPPQDMLLGYHPTVRCFTGGDPNGPREDWLPPAGIAPVLMPADHIVYAQQTNAVGDVYSNAAMVMAPLKGGGEQPLFSFCEIDAWGAVAFSSKSEGAFVDPGCTTEGCARKRRGAHVQWAPAIHWRAVVSWSELTGWDCHAEGANPATWVDRVILTAATHDLPSPLSKGTLPATHDYALFSVEPRTYKPDPEDEETWFTHDSLIARYVEDSMFPMGPQGAPSAMAERNLMVRLPQNGPPADVEVTWSCAEVDPGTGSVSRVGFLLRDVSNIQAPIGAIVVEKTGPTGAWDCVRDPAPADGCKLMGQAEWSLLTPCLLPASPPAP
jgi:hypothetical protein